MLNGMTRPLNGMSGGIVPNFCPDFPSKDDLAKPGVEGASAQAKKDAMEAKARRQAVRYLGTLDCRYYPEAEAGLIAALRTDGVECVRWEAAMALGRGCCCSKKIMAALIISVNGSEKDGNPAERSERVRMAAALALDRCLACACAPVEEEKPVEKPKETAPPPRETAPPPAAKPPGMGDTGKTSRTPDKQTIADGRTTLQKFYGQYGLQPHAMSESTEVVRLAPVPTTTTAATPVALTPRPVVVPVKQRSEPKSLYSIFKDSMGSNESTTAAKEVKASPAQQVASSPATTISFDSPMPGVMPNAVAAFSLKPTTVTPAPKSTISAPAPGATYIFFDTPDQGSAPKR
jgi:hypothetical protein